MTLVFDKQTSVPSSSSAQAILTNSPTSLGIIPGTISFDVATTTPAAAVTTTTPAAAVTTTTPAAAVTTTTPAAAVTTTTPAAAVTTTTPAVASTDPPSSSEGTLGLRFSLHQPFNSNLSNRSSSEFKTLSANVVTNVNKVYAGTPGFNRSIVNSFRNGSVVTDMTLVFDKQSSVPSSSTAQTILTNSSTSLNILPGSIRVDVATTTPAAAVTTTTPAAAVTTTTPAAAVTTTTPAAAVTTTTPAAAVTTTTPAAAVTTTTPAVASTDPPSSSEGILSLRFSLHQPFNSNLSNRSSSEFKTLSANVVTNVNKVYAKTPGFNRSIVNSFRNGSVVTNMTLVFDKQSSVPSSSTAQTILTNSSTSLNILPGSIRVDVATTTPAAAVTTTTPAAAVTTTTPAAAVTTTTPAAAVTSTTPAAAVTTTTPAAAVPTTTTTAAVASTDPPSSSEGILSLRFSLNQTFNSDLSNPSSSAFKTLSTNVVTNVNKAYAKTPGFRRSIVNSFRSGSVVTDMTLVFDKQSSVPSSSSAQTILTNSSTSLNILPGSISVGSSTTSGSAPQPTAFSLAALPLSLALLMVQLLSS
ncbi:cell wall protein DAN4 isoform X2 [Salmo salar]|uniref:Cell wall protein DAN4 isoform X2 n=1 Tax=Salmo salar TaxID=8030 RepID=A0ABM3EAV5_SALSA|nr:cell wall protein DAN4-like isoform X2 [Salmo salar]